MNNQSPNSVFWRDLQLIELDCGRPAGWNPIFSNAVTVYRSYDHLIGQFRPLIVPITQIIDPFGEVNFHSNQATQDLVEPITLQQNWRRTWKDIRYPNINLHRLVSNNLKRTRENLSDSSSSNESEEEDYLLKIRKRRRNRARMNERLTRHRRAERLAAGEVIPLHTDYPEPKRRKRQHQQQPTIFENPNINNMASPQANFPRPKPNYKTKFGNLTNHLKIIHRIMRKQAPTVTDEVMDRIYEEEYIRYNLNENPSLYFDRILLRDAVQAMQEVSLELMSWQFNDWCEVDKQLKAQSLLEGVMDVIFIVWHELFAMDNGQLLYLKQTAWKHVYELDMLYNRLLNICYNLNMKSPLTVLGYRNPLMNNQQNPLITNQTNPSFNISPPQIVIPNGTPMNNGSNYVQQHAMLNVFPLNNNGPNNVQNIHTNNNEYNLVQENIPQSNNNGFNNVQSSRINNNGPNYVQHNIQPSTSAINLNQSGNNGSNNVHNINASNNGFNNTQQTQRMELDDDYDHAFHNQSTAYTNRQNNLSQRHAFRNNRFASDNQPDLTRRKFDDTELKIVNTIKSWPNKFDGCQGHFKQYVESWMLRVNEDITPQKILANIEWLLEGEALKWHKIFGININDWQEYERKLQSYLNRGKNDVEIEADFNDGRHNQRKSESFVAYYTRIKALSNKMKEQPSEARLFERIKRGLHNDYFFCKISASDTNDLMSKCAEYEATLPLASKQENQYKYEPFKFLKDKPRNEEIRKPSYQFSNNRQKFGEKWEPKQNNFPDYRNKFWGRHRSQPENTNDKSLNAMITDDSDEEVEIPELTRGNPRELDDSDREYLEIREMEIVDYAQKMKMNPSDYKNYQERQKCQNCHVIGHTIDQCPLARRGVWFEHCKKCGTTNVTFNNCPNCTKNQ